MDKPSDGPIDALAHDTPPLMSADVAAPILSLLDSSSDGVIIVDAVGRCMVANAAAERLLGYERDDWQTLVVDDVVVGNPGGLLRAGRQNSGPRLVRRKDGSLVATDVWSTGVERLPGSLSLMYLRAKGDGDDSAEGADGHNIDDASEAGVGFGMTLEGVIASWDLAAERLYGFRGRDVIGRSIATLAPSESINDVTLLLGQVRRGVRVSSFHTSQRTKHGCRIDVCLDVAPVRNDRGDVVSATVAVRDVMGCARNDRELRQARATAKDANRALRESEERFRGAFDGASIGMALVSPEGRIMQANPALRAILGYSRSELLTKAFRDVTHPDDLDSDYDLARQLLTGEIDSYQIEKRYLRKDGQLIWGRLTVSLVRDGARNSHYLVAQVQDITPYKAAGAALREAEARYRTLVEQIPAAVYVDAGEALGTPRYVSPRIQALLGYSPQEWVADPDLWIRAIHPDDRERIVAAVAGADGAAEPMHLEYRFLARDGREVWVHDQVALVRDEDGGGQYWQGFMLDITDRKRAEEELRLAKEAAEEANRLKSAFLSMATHELRTPLTIISGYVEMLAESAMAHFTPEEREFLDIAQTGVSTLSALVDDLLDLARMEAGRLELLIRPVDVMEAIERVRRLVAAQAASKGIAVEVSVAPGLPPVAADLNRLVQVLFNLLGNAVKFTERGSVRTTVRTAGNGIEFRVVDTGIGIAPEALAHIFDEFRQADIGTTRRFGGSGLGLAIAKRLVEMQGGTISVESTVGKGSTFRVWLPAAQPDPDLACEVAAPQDVVSVLSA
ncbi:MAG: sensor hybrid histidine kinase [Thermomicrobiales bacterium]|nr:sensor hybrid histidine kinase [Thermomicrobiales bacterium]